ncbi:MAG TPA: hypothetical protein PKA05_09730 [Roseiflexaceae bacterium]|nr:hypothetical protein [Roseiflexaceae bacterium]HMP40646.1 hypothetical protein [Roseiflexaceae bacterium]
MSEQVRFEGTNEQAAIAELVFKVMVTQGAFFGVSAPIRQTLTNLADFFAGQRKAEPKSVAQEIDAALQLNGEIFIREERDGEVFYITTRSGSPRNGPKIDTHAFRQRLHDPENPLPVDDISVVVTTTRPALTTVEPVFISDYWQQQAGLLPMPVGDEQAADEAVTITSEEEAAVSTPTTEAIAEVAEPVAVADIAPVAPTVSTPIPINTVITLPNGVQIDLRRPVADLMVQHGAALTNLLRSAIDADPLRRMVTFGSQVFPEATVANFGKNDLRRISDYLKETGEPLLDTQIIADIFYHNPRQNDYEPFRFALNYRLSREKDFEFVGVEGARLWSVRGLPAIGTKRVKASEMGQITGYLEEGFDDSLADQSVDLIRKNGSLTHILSFFEWEYGILPYSRALGALLPTALLGDQRTSVLRFEFPQHYTSVLAELRYPTGNRGGWLQGLEAAFHEYLVPGAMITIARSSEPHIFSVTYEEQAEDEDRILALDETKKTPKFTFTNMIYSCVVDSDMLVNQQQYGRLRNLKAFPMSERRKGDVMLEHVFQTIGQPVGTRAEPRYEANITQLYVGLNVLRPASREYLAHLLAEGEHIEPGASSDTWQYSPPPEPDTGEEEDDEFDYDDDE